MKVRFQLFLQALSIFKWKFFCVLFNKKVEGVNHRHIGNYFNLYR